MKFRNRLLLLLLLFASASFAQTTPPGINYQAVARDAKGQVLTNKTISLQISLFAGESGGKGTYSEIHRIKTNELGLFSLVVGKGEIVGGDFKQVPWSTMNVWMELALDETGGNNFSTINASQLMAVPYAFHAGSASDLILESEGQEKASCQHTGLPFWTTKGNANVREDCHFIGTTIHEDFIFRTNDIERMRITADGDILITGSLFVSVDINVGRDANIGRNVNVGNDLDVDNNANVDNDLQVGQNADIDRDLNVDRNATIGENLTAGGIVNFTNTTQSTNKDNGAVIIEGGVGIEKNLNVGGNTVLGGTLDIGGILTIGNTTQSTNKDNGALVVEGGVGIEKNVNIGGDMKVTGTLGADGATSLGSTLTASGATTLNSTLAANGQVTINANVGGGDGNYNAYPLRVQGSDQGIAIKVNASTPDGDNNFITFFDSSNSARGRIEGQTSSEVASEPEYIFETSIYAAEIIAAGVNIGLSALPNACAGLGAVACPPEPSVVAIAIAEEVLAIVNEVAYQAFAFANVGVTYQSGSADYAEWLERTNIEERMLPGDIVGVKGGKISKRTVEASQYLVISTNPAVLGNMPNASEEKRYEKVAFMGQIPVKVRGQVNIGDYVLPSGLNDGAGIGVSSASIRPDQYGEIVGIAWSAAPAGSKLSAINLAIGLNTNDVARLVKEQQEKIEALEKAFVSLEQRLAALESGKPYAPAMPPAMPVETGIAQASLPVAFDATQVEEAILLLEDTYRARGVNIEQHPGLKKLFGDQTFRQEVIRKVQENYLFTRNAILKMETMRN